MSNNKKLKISIGLPVYNGSKFIQKRLESILLQTFTDFELIISDNASTDSTFEICKEFQKKDKRIRYIRQKTNMGPNWNFKFVLNEAKYDYFVWAAVDDIWNNDFLKKNIDFLENNKEYVGSMGKVNRYGNNLKNFELSNKDNSVTRKYKIIRKYFRPFQISTISGEKYERVRKFLKNPSALIIYAVYRTDILKKSVNVNDVLASDFIIILNILEYGDVMVLDKILLEYYAGGASSKGLIYQFKHKQIPLIDLIFPYYNFLNFSRRKYGIKFLLSNLRFYTIFFGGIVSNVRELI